MKPYPIWIEIDLDALAHNLRQVKSWINNKSNILAVVKRDAYGHGALEVAEEVIRMGVKMLGVTDVQEGASLRKSGIKVPILVLPGINLNFEEIEELLDLLNLRVNVDYFIADAITNKDKFLELFKLNQ